MDKKKYKVTFQPQGRTVYVLSGTKIIEAAAIAGMIVNTPCGGAGTCGKCRVRVVNGTAEPTSADEHIFNADELNQNWRLGCQNSITPDMIIEVPETSRLVSGHQILTEGESADVEAAASVRKYYVELPEPEMSDNAADIARLQKVIGRFKADLPQLRQVSKVLHDNAFKGTAVLADSRIISFEQGNTTNKCFGIACDIGTTTLVAGLYNLCTGDELAVASRMNPQISFGEDVLSRIKHSASCDKSLSEMQTVLVREINSMIDELCKEAQVSPENIYEIACAGNTTMEHLLCRVDPSSLGAVPFVPAFSRAIVANAADMKIAISQFGLVYVFPVIGGFVGGDTVAGMLATDIAQQDGRILMVDIGTNGEIVLADNGKCLAASTAAGPAFEGARISCGMRATRGAIEKVEFNDDCFYSTIGNTAPTGLCGSGLIDLAAGLLDLGIISPLGRLRGPEQLGTEVPHAIKKRLKKNKNDQYSFEVADSVSLTQKDIRELQLAVGAIRAGVNIILKKAALKTSQLSRVLIAGGFGSFVRRRNAQRIGLLPSDIDHEKISYVGNVALAGAKMSVLSRKARKRAEMIAENVEHLELSLDLDFQNEFADAMMFPEK